MVPHCSWNKAELPKWRLSALASADPQFSMDGPAVCHLWVFAQEYILSSHPYLANSSFRSQFKYHISRGAFPQCLGWVRHLLDYSHSPFPSTYPTHRMTTGYWLFNLFFPPSESLGLVRSSCIPVYLFKFLA